jgi:ferrochelatase
MRSWAPYLADVLAEMAAHGVRRALGIILSPHATEASRERYVDAVAAGQAALGDRAPGIVWARAWYADPLFVEAVADGVRTALDGIAAERRGAARLVFTAHSVPTAMAERSPYVEEIAASARAVAARVGHARWEVAYQSRSGSPREPWLEPDVNDVLRRLAAEGARDVVVVPVGFVCDHVEVLYDLDVEARATAAAAGLGFARAPAVNDHPAFVRLLATLVREAA